MAGINNKKEKKERSTAPRGHSRRREITRNMAKLVLSFVLRPFVYSMETITTTRCLPDVFMAQGKRRLRKVRRGCFLNYAQAIVWRGVHATPPTVSAFQSDSDTVTLTDGVPVPPPSHP